MRGYRHLFRGVRAMLLVVATISALFGAVPSRAAEPSELQPIHGFQPLVAVDSGATGPSVIRLQYALRQHGFYRGPVDGVFGRTTETAVITFQKYVGIARTGAIDPLDWIRMALLPGPDIPYRWEEPDRVEIDLERQLLFVVKGHEIVGILPTSTGSGGTYYSVRNGQTVRATTPEGDFNLRWHQNGWNCDSITDWCVYSYWSFTEFYGIHGYPQVPPWPASHGCSRVHTWDADWLEGHLYVGMPVHVWSERPPDTHPPTSGVGQTPVRTPV